MRILKFGGTSVRNAEWIDRCMDIAEGQLPHAPVLVSSAMGKTTDRLQDIANQAEEGNLEKSLELIRVLKSRHTDTAKALTEGDGLAACMARLKTLFAELGSIVKGLALLKERTDRSNDLILSFGERLATVVIEARARRRGMNASLLDSRDFIKTDSNFSRAIPIEALTRELVRERVKPEPGKLLVTQGFIASTEDGITTTLGRNQSDFTATILGGALEAEEVQIWTDVNGIMTADPRMVPQAVTIPAISYREAAELAHFGARVIHPSTIQPASKLGIPICVRNTGNPDAAGTQIISDVPAEGPKAITFKQNITVVNITSARMLMVYGFLKAIFEIFETHQTSVDLVATSEVSVSMTIDDSSRVEHITRDLEALGSVSAEAERSIVCLVGQGLWRNSIIVSRVFSTLKNTPIRMISLGSSDTNLSLVVPQDKTEETVRSLHKEFFE